MPLLVGLALVGLVVVVLARRRRDRSTLAALRLPLLGAAVAVVPSLAFIFLTQRYMGDIIPLLVLGALAGFFAFVGWASRRRGWMRIPVARRGRRAARARHVQRARQLRYGARLAARARAAGSDLPRRPTVALIYRLTNWCARRGGSRAPSRRRDRSPRVRRRWLSSAISERWTLAIAAARSRTFWFSPCASAKSAIATPAAWWLIMSRREDLVRRGALRGAKLRHLRVGRHARHPRDRNRKTHPVHRHVVGGRLPGPASPR